MIVNEKVLALWPVEPSERPPIRVMVSHKSDVEYIAEVFRFSVKSLESDGLVRTDTHFICYEGINPYKKWQELVESAYE